MKLTSNHSRVAIPPQERPEPHLMEEGNFDLSMMRLPPPLPESDSDRLPRGTMIMVPHHIKRNEGSIRLLRRGIWMLKEDRNQKFGYQIFPHGKEFQLTQFMPSYWSAGDIHDLIRNEDAKIIGVLPENHHPWLQR